MSSGKKYGLIVPDRSKPAPIFKASRNVFGDDSDSENETNKKPILLRPSHNINRQAKIAQSKAVVEDPTVFQYDEVYDDMKSEKEVKKEKSKEEKKPRYIENLLKTANKRKIENERRIERQIQKEREEEGEQFADKEVFVTSAYKKKLEEMSKEEEREKREEYLESIGDVTKQRDLGGFYRHLFEQKLGSDKKSDAEAVPESKSNDESRLKNKNDSKLKDKRNDSGDVSKKRNYRKRKSSSENKQNISDGEVGDSDEEINRLNLNDIQMAKKSKQSQENIDADSDFSIDDSSEDESKEAEASTKDIPTNEAKKEETTLVSEKPENNAPDIKKETTIVPEVKPKIDIWKKRTVGVIFDEALKRYYERKAARSI